MVNECVIMHERRGLGAEKGSLLPEGFIFFKTVWIRNKVVMTLWKLSFIPSHLGNKGVLVNCLLVNNSQISFIGNLNKCTELVVKLYITVQYFPTLPLAVSSYAVCFGFICWGLKLSTTEMSATPIQWRWMGFWLWCSRHVKKKNTFEKLNSNIYFQKKQ